jgi:hypothetical protein
LNQKEVTTSKCAKFMLRHQRAIATPRGNPTDGISILTLAENKVRLYVRSTDLPRFRVLLLR